VISVLATRFSGVAGWHASTAKGAPPKKHLNPARIDIMEIMGVANCSCTTLTILIWEIIILGAVSIKWKMHL
jgi:hypothetical protein